MSSSRSTSFDRTILQTLFDDDALSDVTLRAINGVKVKAHRCILAASSDVFRRMFVGDFAEASRQVVDVGFDGETLKALKEHIYTGDVGSTILGSNEQNILFYDISAVHSIISLASAADFFNLGRLCEKSVELAFKVMERSRYLAPFFLEQCHRHNVSQPPFDAIASDAFEWIRIDPLSTLWRDEVASLQASTLELILKDRSLNADEMTLFRVVEIWLEIEVEISGRESKTNRKKEATKLMKHIELERIKMKDLVEVVDPSGLAPRDQLYEAYRCNAMLTVRAQRDGTDRLFSEPRLSFPRWKSSGTDMFSPDSPTGESVMGCVDHPCMRHGDYIWSMRPGVYKRSFFGKGSPKMGIASVDGKSTWLIDGGGCAYSNGVNVSNKRSLLWNEPVNFKLRIARGVSGRLAASLEVSRKNGDMVYAFDKISLESNKDESVNGFIMVAFAYPKSRIQINFISGRPGPLTCT